MFYDKLYMHFLSVTAFCHISDVTRENILDFVFWLDAFAAQIMNACFFSTCWDGQQLLSVKKSVTLLWRKQ